MAVLELLDHILRDADTCWPLDETAAAITAAQTQV
jgi:hypothetical protein